MKNLYLLSGMIVFAAVVSINADVAYPGGLKEKQYRKIEDVQWGKVERQQELARPSVYKMLDALIVGKEKNINWAAVFALLDSMQGVIGVNDYYTPHNFYSEEYSTYSLLALACETHNLLAAKTLLEKYNASPNKDTTTPLMVACKQGDVAMVGLLLKHGANPSQRDPEGKSSFNYAQGKPAILDLLTKYASSAAAA